MLIAFRFVEVGFMLFEFIAEDVAELMRTRRANEVQAVFGISYTRGIEAST